MAKDPAMLWYWSDWHSGTSLMSRFLKGCYMDVLNAQFNFGPLSIEEIKTCLGSDFGQSWPTLQKKFKQADSLFFNERLEYEKEKRKNFCDSRRKNKEGKSHDPTHVKHMIDHMENENRNEDTNGFLWISIVKNFHNDFRWKEKFCRDQSVKLPELEAGMLQFISKIEIQEDHKTLKELKSHFFNWHKKNKNGDTKSSNSSVKKHKRNSSAYDLAEELKNDLGGSFDRRE